MSMIRFISTFFILPLFPLQLLSRLKSREEDLDALETQNSAQRKSIEILRDQCDTLAVEKDNL
jgi:hypothetical protein